MERNVYSLVLAPEVVAQVDKLAYEKNTSRSNLINQILAEYFAFPTPEMRMKSIFDSVEQMMAELESFQVQFQPSDAMISIRSALRYRYNPTIRYVLELYRDCDPAVGQLRVSARTQSSSLIQVLTEFFRFWAKLEVRLIGSYFPEEMQFFQIENGKFTREFLMPAAEEMQSNEGIANAIGDYIQLFDVSLKQYFANLDDPETAAAVAEQNYKSHLKQHDVI